MYYKKFLKQSDAQLKVNSEIRAQLLKEISDDTIESEPDHHLKSPICLFV